jgi:hypothetical protein
MHVAHPVLAREPERLYRLPITSFVVDTIESKASFFDDLENGRAALDAQLFRDGLMAAETVAVEMGQAKVPQLVRLLDTRGEWPHMVARHRERIV